MQVIPTEIPNVMEIRPVRHHDARGFFSEIFRESVLRENGITATFVQENHSLSMDRFVIRGLHFQIPPVSQAKLWRVAAGSIFDVAVDIRTGSPNYGRHVALILSAALGNQLFEYRKGSRTGSAPSSRILRSSTRSIATIRANMILVWPGMIPIWRSLGRCHAIRCCCPTRTAASQA